jgi:hypothetical protein
MRRGLIAGAAFVLLVAGMNVATAQGGGGGRGQGRGGFGGRGGGGLFMLRMKEVQEELKMTQPQVEKLDAKQQEVMAAMQELRQNGGGQNASPEDFQKMMAKGQEIQTKAVADILDTKQLKRFHQLELQQMGPSALGRKEVADELKLTDAQKKSIGEIQQKTMEETRALFQDFQNMTPEDRQAAGAKMQAAQKAAGEKIAAVLTDAQKSQWKAMQGEPFKFPPMGPGGGRRPGGAPPPPAV